MMSQRETRPRVAEARLRFHTARVSYGGPGRIQITAAGDDEFGKNFAPTWKLVNWGKSMLAHASTEAAKEWAFKAYAERYRMQMLLRFKSHRSAWDELLMREEAVLCCFCNHHAHCHRYLLAEFLQKLGATYLGELHNVG